MSRPAAVRWECPGAIPSPVPDAVGMRTSQAALGQCIPCLSSRRRTAAADPLSSCTVSRAIAFVPARVCAAPRLSGCGFPALVP